MNPSLTLRLLAVACTVAGAFASPAAQAQISNDVVRIGFITDMSGPYADTDGLGGLEAIRMRRPDDARSAMERLIGVARDEISDALRKART